MECVKCGKTFKHLSKLKRHVNRKISCTNNRDYKCRLCKKKFRDKTDYTRHMNRKTLCIQSPEKMKDKIRILELELELQKLKTNNTTINNTYNNTINNNIYITPLDANNINLNKITIEHAKRGIDGICDILLDIITENGMLKYICVDLVQLIYKRLCKVHPGLNQSQTWEYDLNGEYLKKELYPKIVNKLHEVYGEYASKHPMISYDGLTMDDNTYKCRDNIAKLNRVVIDAEGSDNYHKNILHKLNGNIYITPDKLTDYM